MKHNIIGEPAPLSLAIPSEGNSVKKPCKAGDRIHIHSKQGIYYVSGISNLWIVITCKVWKQRYDEGTRKTYQESIPYSDFKCLAGGLWNL